MKPVYVMYSRTKLVMSLVLVVGILCVDLYCLNMPMIVDLKDIHAAMKGLIIPISGMIIIYLSKLFTLKPALIIDDAGILMQSLRIGVIPWSEITNANLFDHSGYKIISLALRNHDQWLARLPTTRKALSSFRALSASFRNTNNITEFNQDLSGTTTDAHKILALIKGKIATRKLHQVTDGKEINNMQI